jgi:hypothetical protein
MRRDGGHQPTLSGRISYDCTKKQSRSASITQSVRGAPTTHRSGSVATSGRPPSLLECRRFAAADNELLVPELTQDNSRGKSVKSTAIRVGSWLSQPQAQVLLSALDITTIRESARPRDPCRPSRLRVLTVGNGGAHVPARPAARRPVVHRRSRRKHGRVRTAPMPAWVKVAI